MAHIVEFRVHALKATGRSVRKRAAGSAEIVLFPGVRYERWTDGPAARSKVAGPLRDLIDLPD